MRPYKITAMLASIATLATLATQPAWAEPRPFPADARRGTMTPAYHPEMVINGKTRRLSAAARIFNDENMIEMPAGLRGRDYVVNYQEDGEGQIRNIWILTREEASQRMPASN